MSVLPSAAAERAVGERLAPAELFVLDVVDVFGDREHPFDVVRDAVAVGVLEVRRVEALVDPVDAEVGVAGGRIWRLGDGVGVAGRRDPFGGAFERFGRARARLDERRGRGGGVAGERHGDGEQRSERRDGGDKSTRAHPDDLR